MNEIRELERVLYALVSANPGGISYAALSRAAKTDVFEVKKTAASSPVLTDLCYKNAKGNICPMICGTPPHLGLDHYSWYYSDVRTFLNTDQNEIMESMEDSCLNTASVLGAPRFPERKAKLIRCSAAGLFKDLEISGGIPSADMKKWEISFFTDISTRHGEFEASCDSLLITGNRAYPFFFLNSEAPSERSAASSYRNSRGFCLVFGEKYEIIPVIVLIKRSGFFEEKILSVPEGEDTGITRMCCASRDQLYRIFAV